jgi:hypothetical protein
MERDRRKQAICEKAERIGGAITALLVDLMVHEDYIDSHPQDDTARAGEVKPGFKCKTPREVEAYDKGRIDGRREGEAAEKARRKEWLEAGPVPAFATEREKGLWLDGYERGLAISPSHQTPEI